MGEKRASQWGSALVIAAAAAVALSACSSGSGKKPAGTLEARPMIMPGQHAIGGQADPFGSVRVPATEDAYNSLTPAQQARLVTALRAVNCAHPPTLTGTTATVACDDTSYAYLLGAPIFTADDVEHATTIPPTQSTVQWSVALTLDAAGGERAYQWTSKHHALSQDGVYNTAQTSPTAKPPCGPDARADCSDFLAYVSDHVVVTIPVTFGPVQTGVVVSGDFNERSATQFAKKVAG